MAFDDVNPYVYLPANDPRIEPKAVAVRRETVGGTASGGRPSGADYREALGSRELLSPLSDQVYVVAHLLTHFEDVEEAIDAMVADLSEELSSR